LIIFTNILTLILTSKIRMSDALMHVYG